MTVFPFLPHAQIPAGALNTVGDPLPNQVTPNDLDIIDNARHSARESNTSKMFSHRQIFVGLVLRVDNDYIMKDPAGQPMSSPSKGIPLPTRPKTLKIRVFIPAIHAAFGRLNVSWPSSEIDHFYINQFTQVVGPLDKLNGRKPKVGDGIVVNIQDLKTQTILEAGNILGYAYSGTNDGDILNVSLFSGCEGTRATVANTNASAGRSLPTINRARAVNNENPNRVGNVQSNPQTPQQNEQQQPQNDPPAGTPGETSGTPKCKKVYSVAGVAIAQQEAHANLANNTDTGSRTTKPIWAWGKQTGTAPCVKFQGKWITEDLLTPLKAMFDAAAADGVNLRITSAYRSPVAQRSIRRRYVKRGKHEEYLENGNKIKDTYSGRTFTKWDSTNINDNTFIMKAHSRNFNPLAGRPGGGRGHQAGVCVDISTGLGNTKKKLKNIENKSPAYFWLANNSYKFGFVRTVKSERWHYAYMGRPCTKPTLRIPFGHWSWDDTLEGSPFDPITKQALRDLGLD